MISVKLTRAECRDLIWFLRWSTQGQEQIPLLQQSTSMLVLMDYLATWTTSRLLTWNNRQPGKEYQLKLKPVVMLAIFQEMGYVDELSHEQQLLRDKLDKAIVDYHDPRSTPHVIGQLVRQ
jgi:hypothetical protein